MQNIFPWVVPAQHVSRDIGKYCFGRPKGADLWVIAIYYVAMFYLALKIWKLQTLMRKTWSRLFNSYEVI